MLLLLLSAIAFFALITGLILIHELGHFVAARLAGVEVEEFGFGLPPRATTLFHWRGTDFTLNWIPFGGFVRLKGENAQEVSSRDKGSFARTPFAWRCLILVAGVGMNFLLALLIFFFGFSWGRWIPTYLSLADMEQAADRGEVHMRLGVLIDDVLTGGTAADARVAKGSFLAKIDGVPVTHSEDVVTIQKGKASVVYTLLDPETKKQTDVRVNVEDGKTGVYLTTVAHEISAPTRSLPHAAMLALREVKVVTVQTVLSIVHLFGSLARSGQVPEGVTGIVGIAQLTYSSVQGGFAMYLRLVALLSLSLAVLNILPFPALDGGRLVFVIADLFYRPKTRRFELITNTVGFVVLLGVILLVTFYDVLRLFS